MRRRLLVQHAGGPRRGRVPNVDVRPFWKVVVGLALQPALLWFWFSFRRSGRMRQAYLRVLVVHPHRAQGVRLTLGAAQRRVRKLVCPPRWCAFGQSAAGVRVRASVAHAGNVFELSPEELFVWVDSRRGRRETRLRGRQRREKLERCEHEAYQRNGQEYQTHDRAHASREAPRVPRLFFLCAHSLGLTPDGEVDHHLLGLEEWTASRAALLHLLK